MIMWTECGSKNSQDPRNNTFTRHFRLKALTQCYYAHIISKLYTMEITKCCIFADGCFIRSQGVWLRLSCLRSGA